MRIAIIPARGGSKRIPKKNILPFYGKPMIAYALEAVQQSGMFDEIHVSTDCNEIAQVAKQLGHPIDFLRTPELADDHTGLLPVLNWVLDKYAEKGARFESVCCLMPNAPLITAVDIQKACITFEQANRIHPLLAFARFPVPVEWAFRKANNGIMTPVSPAGWTIRSQDLEEAYYECGPFTFWSPAQLRQENPLAQGVLSHIMPPDRAVDIDTHEDLAYAQRLYKLINIED